jgi:hypothetical protein
MPLNWFYTGGICIDLSHVRPKAEYTFQMTKEALVNDEHTRECVLSAMCKRQG